VLEVAWRKLELNVEPPFNYKLSLEATPPLPPLEVRGSLIQRSLNVGGAPIPVKLSVEGGTESPRAALLTPSWVDEELAEAAAARAEWMICAKLRLEDAYRSAARDAKLRRLVEELRGLKPWLSPDPWEGLATSIVFQQVSLKAAYAMLLSLVERLGRSVEVGGEAFKSFPTPSAVASASIDELRACKLSRAKASYIHEVAELIEDGSLNLEGLAKLPTPHLIARLKELRGVGDWTAELASLISYARWEVVPAADLGIRRALAELFNLPSPPSPSRVRELTEPWGPWRGLTAYYALIAYERGLLGRRPSPAGARG
jgi:DNA-3-methyladenine glycosylase II